VLADEGEVDARQYQHNAKNLPQQHVFYPLEEEDAYRRHDNKRDEHRQEALPHHEPTQSHGYSERCGECQHARESDRLAVGRHKMYQHRHDENAETETCCALDETRPDAQEYKVYRRDVHSLDA